MKITDIVTGNIETWMHLHARPLKREHGIRISVPVTCYLLEHAGKKVLFDAGQVPLQYAQNPLSDYFVRMTDEQTAVCQLGKMGIAASDIDLVIISHFHGDHIAGLRDFPDCKVLVQTPEVEKVKKYDNRIIAVDGEYDVSGDGAMVCVPTYGHSPGHQSLLLRRDDGSRLLLVGDAVYMPEALEYLPDEAEYAERKEYFDSLGYLRALQSGGTELVFGHYPVEPVDI